MSRITRVLAPEHDERAVASLEAALGSVRAIRLGRFAGHAGSQEIDSRWYWVHGRVVRTQRETYMRLRVTGPAALVELVAAAMHVQCGVAAG